MSDEPDQVVNVNIPIPVVNILLWSAIVWLWVNIGMNLYLWWVFP